MEQCATPAPGTLGMAWFKNGVLSRRALSRTDFRTLMVALRYAVDDANCKSA